MRDSLALRYQRIKLVFTFSNLYSWFCIDTSEEKSYADICNTFFLG